MIQIDELNDYVSINHETPKYNETKESFLSKGLIEKSTSEQNKSLSKPNRRNILVY